MWLCSASQRVFYAANALAKEAYLHTHRALRKTNPVLYFLHPQLEVQLHAPELDWQLHCAWGNTVA